MNEDLTVTRELRNFEWGNASHIGRVRQVNEDYYGYFNTINGHVFVVCDGMGGHTAGEKASKMAIESVRTFFEQTWHEFPKIAINYAIIQANHDIFYEARKNPELSGMGTTIVIALIRDEKIYYGHVGDSRIYMYSNAILQQLTKDHSYVQNLVDQGIISLEDAAKHPRKNQITSALGIEETIPHISVAENPISPADEDILILCSDGLYGMVGDEAIVQILQNTQQNAQKLQDTALQLINEANTNGGKDNITVQLVRFYNIEPKISKIQTIKENFKQIHIDTQSIFNKKVFAITLFVLLLVALSYWIANKSSKENEKGKEVPKIVNTDSIKNKQLTDSISVNLKPDTIITFTLQKKTELPEILEKYHLSEVIFIKYNNFKTNILEKGSKVKIPFQTVYTVEKGDGLSKIGRQFRVSPDCIIIANSLRNKILKPKQKLLIPLM